MLRRKAFFVVSVFALLSAGLWAQDAPALVAPPPAPPASGPSIAIEPRVDFGLLYVAAHLYQSGATGTLFDFVTQGGQDTLFPYERYSVDLVIDGVHRVSFLYQPLTLTTSTVVGRNGSLAGPLVVDGTSFPSGTPMDLKYGFDFWRLSYMYDFLPDPDAILAAGLSLQVRNAAIDFSAADGGLRAVQQNIGPVPILKFRAGYWFRPEFGLDLEADGFYASSAFFNGSGKDFEGWIWDAALTVSTRFAPGTTAFLALRTIGGGARGNNAYSYVSSTTSSPGSYTYNALATVALTLGATLR